MRIIDNIIKHRKKILFFVFFYLIIGSCGVWVPALFSNIQCDDISIGLITIVISSMYSSAEKILSILSIGRKDKGLEGIIYLIAIGIPFIISLGIGKLIFEELNVIALIASIIIYILSWWLWWYQNSDNPALIENPIDIIGGDIE